VARHRLAIVLLVPEAVAVEVDGIRRALGDATLGRIPAHVTLVPPVNVREDDLAAAFDVAHAAAAACPPLPLTLGPVATFAPVNPVAYLEVRGAPGDLACLHGLRDDLHAGPLDREPDYAFVPHATVAPELPPDRLEAARLALSAYAAEVRFERIHVLAEQPGRVWHPVGDAALGRATRSRSR
jgi:2'-5' RNA ligase